MSRKGGRLKPKSKETIREAVDIVRNAQDDDAAIEFLKDTLDDDFPDLELGSMNLHEAIKVLGGSEQDGGGDRRSVGDLSKALGDFISKQEKTTKVKPKPKPRKKRKKRKKK